MDPKAVSTKLQLTWSYALSISSVAVQPWAYGLIFYKDRV